MFSGEGSLGGLESHVKGSREPHGVDLPAPCLCSGLPAYSSQVPCEVPLVVLMTENSGDHCLGKVFLDRTWLMVTKLTIYSAFLPRKQKPLQINSEYHTCGLVKPYCSVFPSQYILWLQHRHFKWEPHIREKIVL